MESKYAKMSVTTIETNCRTGGGGGGRNQTYHSTCSYYTVKKVKRSTPGSIAHIYNTGSTENRVQSIQLSFAGVCLMAVIFRIDATVSYRTLTRGASTPLKTRFSFYAVSTIFAQPYFQNIVN
jgi:hypothetical protein